jgi:hypothetical protein
VAPWGLEADGRPAVCGGALPLRLQKERAFFSTFGDEERLAFISLVKLLGEWLGPFDNKTPVQQAGSTAEDRKTWSNLSEFHSMAQQKVFETRCGSRRFPASPLRASAARAASGGRSSSTAAASESRGKEFDPFLNE